MVKRSCSAGDLGMEKHLKEQVAKFFGKFSIVLSVEGFENFVGFFNEVGAESGVSLLTVPGTATRGAQAGHYGHELFEPLARRFPA